MELIYEVTVIENTVSDFAIWSEVFESSDECQSYMADVLMHNQMLCDKRKPEGKPLLTFTVLLCCYLPGDDYEPARSLIREFAK